jgi:transcriptional regulator GlxA family with amidase domain
MARADGYSLEQWLEMARKSAYRAAVLSHQLKISRRQLERCTQKLFERSPQAWLNDVRLVEAAAMLKKHRFVRWVAVELGFKQVSHFSLQFKLYYGVSPSKYLAWSDRQTVAANTVPEGKTARRGPLFPE